MKKTNLQKMQEKMRSRFGREQGGRIAEEMQKDYDRLCQTQTDIPESFVRHTRNNIFPVAAAFHALLQEGMDRQEAAKIADAAFLEIMEVTAGMLRKMLKVPGLYRLMPGIWKTMMPRLFREDSGFQFAFYPTDRRQVKFDMKACPYLEMCKALGCPELAPTFCATDDTCYGHMHPKLLWNRTKTMARGGDVCDFDLSISSE